MYRRRRRAVGWAIRMALSRRARDRCLRLQRSRLILSMVAQARIITTNRCIPSPVEEGRGWWVVVTRMGITRTGNHS